MPENAYAVDDPTVIRLGKFLANTPLSNGQYAPIPEPLSTLVAQAVCNYTANMVWDNDNQSYLSLGEWESTPEFGDVQVENVTGTVTRMTHRTTGITVLGETPDDAWNQLRAKVTHA